MFESQLQNNIPQSNRITFTLHFIRSIKCFIHLLRCFTTALNIISNTKHCSVLVVTSPFIISTSESNTSNSNSDVNGPMKFHAELAEIPYTEYVSVQLEGNFLFVNIFLTINRQWCTHRLRIDLHFELSQNVVLNSRMN